MINPVSDTVYAISISSTNQEEELTDVRNYSGIKKFEIPDLAELRLLFIDKHPTIIKMAIKILLPL